MNSIVFDYDELVKIYEDLIDNPENILGTDQEFKAFLDIPSSMEDLLAFKQACIKYELYEWAAEIQRKIQSI